MPQRPPSPCAEPGCPALVHGARCERHDCKRQHYAAHPRGSSTRQGYGADWRTARAAFLGGHPLCAECERAGQIVAATIVDHIQPHRGDRALFWDRSNWQSLCKRHHDRKTAREGRWG